MLPDPATIWRPASEWDVRWLVVARDIRNWLCHDLGDTRWLAGVARCGPGADGTVTVSVVADCPPNAVPALDSDCVRTSTVLDGDRLWIKATWRGGS